MQLHWFLHLKLKEWKQLLSVILLNCTTSAPLVAKEFSFPTAAVHSFATKKGGEGVMEDTNEERNNFFKIIHAFSISGNYLKNEDKKDKKKLKRKS